MSESVKVKRIDIKEFRTLGFLQEANRHFFHPLGLALEIVQENCKTCGRTGYIGVAIRRVCSNCDGYGYTERLGGIWDYREDPEGITYSDDQMSREKASNVLREFARHLKERNWMFEVQDGIQPLPDSKNPEPKERLRDLIEQGHSAHRYWAICDHCHTEMGTNMMGMGTCPSCGYQRNPLAS